jgi:hypothetical protein
MDLLAAVMIFSVLTRPRAGMDGGLGGATRGQLRRRPPTIGPACQTPSPTPPA